MAKTRQNILKQLFDIKPMTKSGDLHLEKIRGVKKHLNLRFIAKEEQKDAVIKLNENLTDFSETSSAPKKNMQQDLADSGILDEITRRQKEAFLKSDFASNREKILSELEMILASESQGISSKSVLPGATSQNVKNNEYWDKLGGKNQESRIRDQGERRAQEITSKAGEQQQPKSKFLFSKYAILAGFLAIIVLGGVIVKGGIDSKDEALGYATLAAEEMMSAKEDLKNMNFEAASDKFESAGRNFEKSKKSIGRLNYLFLSAASGLPIVSESKLSGINIIDAGVYLAKAGEMISSDVAVLSRANPKDIFELGGKSGILEAMENLDSDLDKSLSYIDIAKRNIENTDASLLPDGISKKELTEKIAQARLAVVGGQDYLDLILDLMGAKRQKEYLLLFQNPGEMRATGGFIGSYGVVKIDNGKIKKIFVDDVFNPDGQLTEKVVPPFPIQKISTAWSMHDANWFFDFPLSAKKVAWFYEKTGGPSADAVVSINPFVIERLLGITGPIDMPEYNTVITAENFIDIIQHEVEEGDNKKDNQPKKILADFMPKFFGKLFSHKENLTQIIEILKESAEHKDIMAYSFDDGAQKIISDKGFSGEVIDNKNDYLAVVSSNINGYKTDRMIDGSIDLQSEINEDGYIINTLTIKKIHNGGDSQYDFYNKVNTDYLRVYVPEGSVLLDAQGHTIEKNKSPADYDKLGFKKDEDVVIIESSMLVDEKTKTNVYQESGKTVFGNWVFVSPGKKVDMTYKYRLPHRVYSGKDYEIIFQKQSGSKMNLNWEIKFPDSRIIISDDWDLTINGNSAKLNSDFKTDKIIKLRFK